MIAELRTESYQTLVTHYLDGSHHRELVGESGVSYQVEILAVWDGLQPGNLRVIVAVDDGRWRAFIPLSEDFIIAPDGSFVGE